MSLWAPEKIWPRVWLWGDSTQNGYVDRWHSAKNKPSLCHGVTRSFGILINNRNPVISSIFHEWSLIPEIFLHRLVHALCLHIIFVMVTGTFWLLHALLGTRCAFYRKRSDVPRLSKGGRDTLWFFSTTKHRL